MGSTTRSGRTRNRRIVQPWSPPDGYPKMLVFGNVARDSATEFRFAVYNQIGDLEGFDFMVITGPVQIFVPEDNEYHSGTATYDDVTKVITITFSTTPPDDVVVIFIPWQEGLRGPNGEWFGPYVFTTPVTPP